MEAEVQLTVAADVEDDGDNAADDLAEHRGDGRTGHAHGRDPEPRDTEDQDGVKNNVDERACALRDHGKHGASGCLQKPFENELRKEAHGENTADGEIVLAERDDLRVGSLAAEEEIHGENTDQNKDGAADDLNENALKRDALRARLVALAEALGEQGVYADADADAERDHKILNREGDGDGCERGLADARDKDAVHDVVKRLYEHGGHHWQRHADKQLPNWHCAHFVLRKL